MKNDTFLRAASGAITREVPIWLMRQAGRYLQEYNQVRSRVGTFLDLCFNPDAASEVTIQPIDRFSLDAAIIFSDILLVPYAMNMKLDFIEQVGPVFERPISDENDIDNLNVDAVTEFLHPVYEGISYCQKELAGRVPLIGFVGSPFTLSCYMLEGRSSTDFLRIKKLRYSRPDCLYRLIEKVTVAVENHLLAQIDAGANAAMIFDSWAGILSTHDYMSFSLPSIKRLVSSVKQRYPDVPVIVFAKGAGLWLESIASSNCDVVALDWTVDLELARKRLQGFDCALQGNLDPLSLLGSTDILTSELDRIARAVKGKVPYIFNLGHGVHRFTPVENVNFLVEKLRELFLCGSN